MKIKLNLTFAIFSFMLLGIAVGIWIFYTQDEVGRKTYAENFGILTDIFLRLIKMIIAPLVFTTLVVGIAKIGDIKTIGKIGGKAMIWFMSASIISLLVGMVVMNVTEVGKSLSIENIQASADTTIGNGLSFKNFIVHLVPKSVIEAMALNEILQIVIFSIFFGLATASLGAKGKIVIEFFDVVAHIILKVTRYVMYFSPLAAFAGLGAVVSTKGPGVLQTYLTLIAAFFIAILILWTILILVGFVMLKKRIFELLKIVFPSFLIAFSTATSESAFPSLIKQLKSFGCNEKIVTLVLPLGYSFNLDGSMMYTTFASLFIAQAYGINLSFQEQVTMLAILMVTSKGMAGTPRASLVIVASTLAAFHIPEVGIALLLGVDQIFDMARTGTNVIGNSLATVAVSKWEKQLAPVSSPLEDD